MIDSAPEQLPSPSSVPVTLPGNNLFRFIGFLLLAVALALAGCSSDPPGKGQKGGSGKNAAVAVTTALCRSKDVPVIIEATGRVEASATVGIRSRINGTLDTVHFTEGQEVQKGDLLFSIDQRPYVAQLKAKEALLAKDRAELANAKQDLDRYLPAAKNGYVSQEQADQAATKVTSLAATVQADEAALDSARLDLQFCSLSAPFTGRAGEIQADAGNLIKANADTPLVTINRISPITVAFDIPGKELSEVQQYQAKKALEVQVKLPGKDGGAANGTLSFVDNSIDPATGTIRLKADFTNTGGALWPGQLVAISLRLTIREAAMVIPSQAVQTGQDGAHVYVVRQDSTVEYRQVVPGTKSGSETVIEEGLKVGERVVTDGHLQLVDGGKIEDRTANQPADQKAKGRKRGGS